MKLGLLESQFHLFTLQPFQRLICLKAVTFRYLSFWDFVKLLAMSSRYLLKELLPDFPNRLKAFGRHLEGRPLGELNLRFYRLQVSLPFIRLTHRTYIHQLGHLVKVVQELVYQCLSFGDLRFASSQGLARTSVSPKSVKVFAVPVSRVIEQN